MHARLSLPGLSFTASGEEATPERVLPSCGMAQRMEPGGRRGSYGALGVGRPRCGWADGSGSRGQGGPRVPVSRQQESGTLTCGQYGVELADWLLMSTVGGKFSWARVGLLRAWEMKGVEKGPHTLYTPHAPHAAGALILHRWDAGCHARSGWCQAHAGRDGHTPESRAGWGGAEAAGKLAARQDGGKVQ